MQGSLYYDPKWERFFKFQKAQIMGKILQLKYNAIENVSSLKDTKCHVVSWTESWNQEGKSYEIKKTKAKPTV